MPDDTTLPPNDGTDSDGQVHTEIPDPQADQDRDDAKPVSEVPQTPTDLGAAK